MTDQRVLIFANGVLPDLAAARGLIQPNDTFICADGGLRHALALGITPHILVGDLDSIAGQELGDLRARQVEIRRVPADKDETDLELALSAALEQDPARIVTVGALGGRLDHTLGNLAVLLDPRLVGRDCAFDDGVERVTLCRQQADLIGTAGDLVSLIPWGSRVEGVRTEGLRWPLNGETLFAEQSRGISNVLLHERAAVQIRSGLLLIVHRRLTPSAGRR